MAEPQRGNIPMPEPSDPTRPFVKDPTQNVLDSLNAAVQRLDDIGAIQHSTTKELFDEKIKRVLEIMELRAKHQDALMQAESRRIDAIRTVDVNAGAIANERAATMAQTLQTQVATSAETLRALVATTAAAVASQHVQTITPITERLSILERAQYEFKGSSSVADPATSAALAKMALAIDGLTATSGGRTAVKESSNSAILIGGAIFGVISGLIGAVGVVWTIATHAHG
jgi:hypothetical protein